MRYSRKYTRARGIIKIHRLFRYLSLLFTSVNVLGELSKDSDSEDLGCLNITQNASPCNAGITNIINNEC